MKTFVVKSETDLKRCFPVMKELRTHLTWEDFVSIYKDTHDNAGYEIVAMEEGGQILALMGYRFLSDFIRGKHVYVDDLVTTERSRSKGLGAELLRYAEDLAKKNGCKSLRLCTGVENEQGVKFYERNGWTKRAFAFSKKL